MKRFFILSIVCGLILIFFLTLPRYNKAHFVTLQNKTFHLNGKPFYPLALNYIVGFQANENELWCSNSVAYNKGENHTYTNKDSSLMLLQAEFDLIKECGFNTIRIVGAGEPFIDSTKNCEISFYAKINNSRDTSIVLNSDESYQFYFNALSELFAIAGKAGLKVIFLDKVWAETPLADDYLKRLAIRFKKDTNIMAYDLFNEPLYFDKPAWTKAQVHAISLRWNTIFKTYAPNQLTTIGLEGIREIHEWDPNILAFDFLSFHPYEYEPEQVRNEIYWYGKYVKKPWMLGETAIPADDDSVKYSTQKNFALKTLQQTIDCGGIGYSWWQFKDVNWQAFHASYMGIVNQKGETISKRNNICINGTVKPVAEAFKQFDSNKKNAEGALLPNYYNYTPNNAFMLKGKLLDARNKPIEGGVILAWNEWWTTSYHTITKADGTFELTSHYKFYHWIASACGYSMTRNELNPDTAKIMNGIPTIQLGEISIDELPY
jgi:hypothetical protein